MTTFSKTDALKILKISKEFDSNLDSLSEIYQNINGHLDESDRVVFLSSIAALFKSNYSLLEPIIKQYPDLNPDSGSDITLPPGLKKIIESKIKK